VTYTLDLIASSMLDCKKRLKQEGRKDERLLFCSYKLESHKAADWSHTTKAQMVQPRIAIPPFKSRISCLSSFWRKHPPTALRNCTYKNLVPYIVVYVQSQATALSTWRICMLQHFFERVEARVDRGLIAARRLLCTHRLHLVYLEEIY
jgi:hypothetical protein